MHYYLSCHYSIMLSMHYTTQYYYTLYIILSTTGLQAKYMISNQCSDDYELCVALQYIQSFVQYIIIVCPISSNLGRNTYTSLHNVNHSSGIYVILSPISCSAKVAHVAEKSSGAQTLDEAALSDGIVDPAHPPSHISNSCLLAYIQNTYS